MEVKSMGSNHELRSKLFFLSSAEVGGIPGVAGEGGDIGRNNSGEGGLLGYLILFDTHAFVLQSQLPSSKLPSQLVFYQISTHSTATPGIPLTSTVL